MRSHYTALALCLVAVALATPAGAQPNPAGFSGNTGEAITVGPFLFSPAIQLKWEERDNIFFESDDPVSDNIFLARARLMFELPIYESYVRFTYTPQYRDYRVYELTENWSHFVDVATVLEFSNGLRLRADYRYVNANLETSEVDRGGELVYADELFTKNFAAVSLDYWLTERDGITVAADYTDLSYDSQTFLNFYNYDRTSMGIGWLHQLSPILVMDLKYRRTDFNPVNTLDYRKSKSDEVTLGFKGQLSPVVATELRLGWRDTSFDLSPGDPVFDEFSGVVIEGYLNWELAHGSTLRVDLIRSDFPSDYEFNAYYTATGGTVTYDLQRDRFFGELWARLQNNDYELRDPVTGQARSDDITTIGIGLGYRLTRLLSLRGGYLYEDRDTLRPFSYEVNMFSLGLVVGY